MKRRVEVTMSVTRAMLLREGLKVEKKMWKNPYIGGGGDIFFTKLLRIMQEA